MTIDEPTRRSLYDSLVRSLGDSQADTLMSLLPHYPLAELATRDDVHSLAIALRGEMTELRGELRGEMAELRSELRGEMTELRSGLRGEMTDLRSEFRGEMGELRGGMVVGFARVDGQLSEMRGEIAKMSGELRAEFSRQILRLGGIMLAMLTLMLTLGFTGAFA